MPVSKPGARLALKTVKGTLASVNEAGIEVVIEKDTQHVDFANIDKANVLFEPEPKSKRQRKSNGCR